MSYVRENIFPSWTRLEFAQSSYDTFVRLSFDDNQFPVFHSVEIKDCLYLFHGRFSQLENVDLNVHYIRRSRSIPKELCFGLIDLSRGFVHVNYLKRSALPFLEKLNQLTFFIHSHRINPDGEDQSILEILEEMFNVGPDAGITCYGNYLPEEKLAQYHLYSTLSFNEYFTGITNHSHGWKIYPLLIINHKVIVKNLLNPTMINDIFLR